jgi:hypothetical protein
MEEKKQGETREKKREKCTGLYTIDLVVRIDGKRGN